MIRKLKNLKMILKYYWSASRVFLFLYFFRQVFSAVLSAVNCLYLLKVVFEFLEGIRDFNQAFIILSIIVVANVINIIGGNFFDQNYLRQINIKTKGLILNDLWSKAKSVDFSNFDNPEFFDDYNLVMSEAATRPNNILNHMGALIYNIANLFTVIYIIFQIDIMVVVFILLSVVCNYFTDIKITKDAVERDFALAKDNKKIAYFKRIFYLKDYIEELKTKKDITYLLDEYDDAVNDMSNILKKYSKKIGIKKMRNGVAQSVLISYGIYFVLIYDLFIRKNISIGGLSALLGSIWNLTDQLGQFVNNFSILMGDTLYVEKMSDFLNIAIIEDGGNKEWPQHSGVLKMKNVSFAYQNGKNILSNINLEIKPGEKIAIVGENGAGKTTLVNILMGLYPSYSGTIELDGVDIKEYAAKNRKDYIQCLSQDFKMYAFTLKDNVEMGNSYSDESVFQSIEKAGFLTKLQKLDNGLQTILSKEFVESGVDLSGGEKHKVAMARILVSDAMVLCMDEPSSDLDPLGEQNFNRLLMTAFPNKTVIFISHRFFATKNVDNIFMLSDGKILEQGKHDDLIKLNGKYAEMYRIQEEKFSEVI